MSVRSQGMNSGAGVRPRRACRPAPRTASAWMSTKATCASLAANASHHRGADAGAAAGDRTRPGRPGLDSVRNRSCDRGAAQIRRSVSGSNRQALSMLTASMTSLADPRRLVRIEAGDDLAVADAQQRRSSRRRSARPLRPAPRGGRAVTGFGCRASASSRVRCSGPHAEDHLAAAHGRARPASRRAAAGRAAAPFSGTATARRGRRARPVRPE